jgi:pyruvate-formate lyase-activating enzyme
LTIEIHQRTRDHNETYLRKLEEVLSAEQLTVVTTFKPCLIPPKELNDPIRAGQAADNTGIVKRMRKIRTMPERQWRRAKERLVDDYLDRFDHHNFRMTPAERETEKIRLLALLEEVREMLETSFELSKNDLAAQVEPLDRMDVLRREIDYRNPHRQQRPPIYNYLPGLELLAVAHGGCNLRCQYCQNWQYAQKSPLRTRNIEGFTADAMVTEMGRRSIHGVSFTYTEPACCPEFVSEFAALCGEHGLKRTLCSAGFIEKEPFARLVQDMDAVTITYKGADDRFYGKVTAGRLAPVRDAMLSVRSAGKWLEVATLILPTMNDDPAALGNMAKWIMSNLGADTPWIFVSTGIVPPVGSPPGHSEVACWVSGPSHRWDRS